MAQAESANLVYISTSTVLGEGIGLPFLPAKILAGFGILLAAIKDVSTSYDAVLDLFDLSENFLRRPPASAPQSFAPSHALDIANNMNKEKRSPSLLENAFQVASYKRGPDNGFTFSCKSIEKIARDAHHYGTATVDPWCCIMDSRKTWVPFTGSIPGPTTESLGL
ncbi:hypothetical protein EDB87DRAFT_1687315 [Lactarius vividus]|nr:hypothetical protein EDB87DRAFT_1687315 [Lactarius vividus]